MRPATRAFPAVASVLLALASCDSGEPDQGAPIAATPHTSAPSFGPLEGAFPVLDNGVLRLQFRMGDSVGNWVDYSVTKLAGPGAGAEPFLVEGGNNWHVFAIRQPVPDPQHSPPKLARIDADDAAGPPWFVLEQYPAFQRVTFRWKDCAFDAANRADVYLSFRLGAGHDAASVDIAVVPKLTSYALYSALRSFSIRSRQDELTTYEALVPRGMLASDPASSLATAVAPSFEALNAPDGETATGFQGIRPTQLMALVRRDAAAGGSQALYLATRDSTDRVEFKDARIGGNGFDLSYFAFTSYARDLTSKTAALASASPVELAFVQGDWWDAAQRYKDFLEGTKTVPGGIFSAGTLLERASADPASPNALPGAMTELQQAAVLWFDGEFGAPGDDALEQILDYRAQHGLENMLVCAFGNVWMVGDDLGVGEYAVDPAWLANAATLESHGIALMLYVSPLWMNMQSPFFTPAWQAEVTRKLNGDYLEIPHEPVSGPSTTFARIHPASQPFRNHMVSVLDTLATGGVTAFYYDNCFTQIFSAVGTDSTAATTPPGFGELVVPANVEMFEDLVAGVRAADPKTWLTTEFYEENKLALLGIYQQSDMGEDPLTADERVVSVPLHAFLYKRYGVENVAGLSVAHSFFTPPNELAPAPKASFLSLDPAEAEKAKLGALYTAAFELVACGAAVQNPDMLLTYLSSPSTPAMPKASGPLYADVMDFVGRGSRLRSQGLTRMFLNYGELLRPAPLSNAPPPITVPIPGLYGLSTRDSAVVSQVLQGVFRHGQDPDRLLVYLTNIGDAVTAAEGMSIELDLAGYGLAPGFHLAAEYDENLAWTGRAQILSTSTPATIQALEIPAESFRLWFVE